MNPENSEENPSPHIRSFARRGGRLTVAQSRALDTHGREFEIPGSGLIDWNDSFGRDGSVILEIGFGDGANLLESAQHSPEKNFVGADVHRPGLGRVLSQTSHLGLENLRIVDGDALELLTRRIRPSSLHEVWIYFPDPWPKKRHHKRRFVQLETLRLIADRLEPGGSLRLATDVEDYAQHMLESAAGVDELENTAGDAGFWSGTKHRIETKFERRGLRLGHSIFDIVLARRAMT